MPATPRTRKETSCLCRHTAATHTPIDHGTHTGHGKCTACNCPGFRLTFTRK